MDYRSVKDTTSRQYKLLNSGIFNKKGGLLTTDDGYVAVALGSRFGEVGDKFMINLDNGFSFKAIKADEKADKDTYNGCHHLSDGSLIEFVVSISDLSKYNYMAYTMGDISYVDGFNGNVTSIQKEV